MEIIKIKSNYKNSTLLRLAKKYTIDVINKDTNKVNFDDYGACSASDTVKDMYNLFYYMECIKGEMRLAKSCKDSERIEKLKAGEFDCIVSFNNKRLEPVKVVAVM